MTVTILSIVLTVVFISLGMIHLYWLGGGKWGLEKAIPTRNEKEDFLPPPRLATLLVAIVLLLFGLTYFLKSGLTNVQVPHWLTSYGLWIIPSIFIVRAIGEFRYVGFFKKIKDTEFAKADSKWFSPLCLIIGGIGIVIQFINNG